jgi:hypothetical protein
LLKKKDTFFSSFFESECVYNKVLYNISKNVTLQNTKDAVSYYIGREDMNCVSSGYGLLVAFCEVGDEHSSSGEAVEFLDLLSGR